MNNKFILTPEYLEIRHSYWKERIHQAGIWDKRKFGKISFRVGPKSKCFQGMFKRVRKKGVLRSNWEDSITIYSNSDTPDPHKIDNTLVHEMIHQYIAHAGLKDRSAHGPLFRKIMGVINETFRGELAITISSKLIPETGVGKKLHPLLLVRMIDGFYLCCKLSPTNTPRIIKEVKNHGASMGITESYLYASADKYFDSVTACRSRLHGIKIPLSNLSSFIEKYRMVLVK